ncbi:MAG: hypothetical protein ACRD1P_05295 [Thermoanaerobaculia bacterium]
MKTRESIWARRAGLLAAAGFLLAANLGFFLWYRSTGEDRKRALETRRSALAREVETREGEAVRLAAQRDRLSQVSAALDEFYGHRVGGRRETLAPVVDELHALLHRLGVAPAQISYASATLEGVSLSEMVISFGFKSDYGKFKRLLEALESSRRWVVVREVGLVRDSEVPGTVEVRMKLATYFSGEEGPPSKVALSGNRRR